MGGASKEYRVRVAAGNSLFSLGKNVTFATTAFLFIVTAYVLNNKSERVMTSTYEHFFLCLIGGILSGFCHLVILPMDLIKCRIQGGICSNAGEAWQLMKDEAATLCNVAARNGELTSLKKFNIYMKVFCLSWEPTLFGYAIQGGLKFCCYEIIKFTITKRFSYEYVALHKVQFFLLASACGEIIADCCLAPWETVKVGMQTALKNSNNTAAKVSNPYHTPTSPQPGNAADNADSMEEGNATGPKEDISSMKYVFVHQYATGGIRVFFGCLMPLMLRQVPMTMLKFALFEKTVEYFYHTLDTVFTISGPHGAHDVSIWIKLFVAIMSGFVSGFVCAVASCPADTLVSRVAAGRSKSIISGAMEVGFLGLFSGVGVRIAMVGTYTAVQWLIYESFKVSVGLPTTASR